MPSVAGDNFPQDRPRPVSEPPVVGITMGCPVGIGPEIILRLSAARQDDSEYHLVVLGDINVLNKCRQDLAIDVAILPWQPGAPCPADRLGTVWVLPVSDLNVAELSWGKPNAETGRAMADYIKQAVALIQNGALAAMATCPITKTALQAAGYRFPGHTEMLASLCRQKDYGMMMAGQRLKVALVTIHVPMHCVPDMIKAEEVLRLIRLTHRTLREDFGIVRPRLAVAGLNPHAGEGGLFGDEEGREILPAVQRAAALGWQVSGPLPPDTVFSRAANGEFDAVICMYHDQGLIPFKLLHFIDGVNVTMGLPIVRTSVDHGTAYDIAGKGLADPASLKAACGLAASIAENRRRFKKSGPALQEKGFGKQ